MIYDTNKEIPSLSKVRRMERNEHEKIINKNAKELLLKAISYYNNNYPNSTHNIDWKKPKNILKIGELELKKELEIHNEGELYALYDVLAYFHDERQMKKVEDHHSRSRIQSIIKKIIPGGNFIDKLYELYETQRKINIEIKDLEDKLTEERNDFMIRLEKIDNIEKKETFLCDVCGKVCRSAAGIKSHSRVHYKND